jgi:flagellar basal-body rod protein FlgB
MTTQDLALLKGLGAKMQYLNHRQRVIAQNVANADTPEYRPQDLTKVNFESVLEKIEGKNHRAGSFGLSLESTNKAHMLPGGSITNPDEKKQKQTYEVAPVGNAVIMEEQLIKSQETVMDYNLMSSLYQKQVGLLATATGRR